jgi:DDE superfamily endonuclease
MSLDGIHCPVIEPTEFDPEMCSPKLNHAAYAYEIGVSTRRSAIIWVNGPFKAGTYTDIKIFREKGLMQQMPNGKKAIADKGYNGEPTFLATPNRMDSQILKKFKRRSRARHESLNARLKNFKCLSHTWRHGSLLGDDRDLKHQAAFEAVCVIAQYDMEIGKGLFDVVTW